MRALAALLGWLGRRAVVYLLLLAALVAAATLVPWLKERWAQPDAARARLERLEPVRLAAERTQDAEQQALRRRLRSARGRSVLWIDARLGEVRRELAELERTRPGKAALALHLARGDAAAVARDQRQLLAILIRRREVAALERLRADAALARFADLKARARAADRLQEDCSGARQRVAAFDRQWLGRRILDAAARARLAATARATCAEADRTRAAVRLQLRAYRAAIDARREAAARFMRTARALDAEGRAATAALDARLAQDRAVVRDSLQGWAERIDLAGKARLALWLLLAGILTPYAIRTLCYFVLAPLAARRPPIRLQAPGRVDVSAASRSTTSVGVRLADGEELLVRQDYLQSSAGRGDKATQWLLDARRPFTSIAAGLMFLTRVRGGGEVTTISAVRDPFAEVTIVTLPEGAGCVLHPRALAAVAQPVGRPLRITSHWRLGSLSAWLTLQLRYLVFHGPARLVVKGGRGVRVERAEHGRIFGQDQLAGFSASLSYSVTRTETFWPYLFGRESLLKDRVVGGDGVLIVEEAPFARRGGGGRRGGLEGAVDGMLKALGI